jgi:hypothetical protein
MKVVFNFSLVFLRHYSTILMTILKMGHKLLPQSLTKYNYQLFFCSISKATESQYLGLFHKKLIHITDKYLGLYQVPTLITLYGIPNAEMPACSNIRGTVGYYFPFFMLDIRYP